MHEIKCGDGPEPTNDELAAYSATQTYVAARLAPIALSLAPITGRLRIRLSANAPRRQRGESRETHSNARGSTKRAATANSDPPRPRPRVETGAVDDDGPGRYRLRPGELEQLYQERDERVARHQIASVFEVHPSLNVSRPYDGERKWDGSTLMRDVLVDKGETLKRPLVDQRPTCTRCDRRVSRRHMSPNRSWCRRCENERRRHAYHEAKTRAEA
jgi:hypothetical protein